MLHLNGGERGKQVSRPGGAVVLGPVAPCACHPRSTALDPRSRRPPYPPREVMISSGVRGCRPARARRTMIRWTASGRVSHDPESGVYQGITPCANSQPTSEQFGAWPGYPRSGSSGAGQGRPGLVAQPGLPLGCLRCSGNDPGASSQIIGGLPAPSWRDG